MKALKSLWEDLVITAGICVSGTLLIFGMVALVLIELLTGELHPRTQPPND